VKNNFEILYTLRLVILQVRSALLAEVEEARRSWEAERCRLQQEVQEQRGAKKNAEEALTSAQQACQARAADLRSAHHQHQEELNRTKRDCEREIRRLVRVTATHVHTHGRTPRPACSSSLTRPVTATP